MGIVSGFHSLSMSDGAAEIQEPGTWPASQWATGQTAPNPTETDRTL
jgi:hypothetical protein